MANYNSSYTGAQHDTYVTASQIINLVYPVGSIYMSTNSTSPQTLFGGTWAKMENAFLIGASSTYTAGSTGGTAAHSHTEGDLAAAIGASADNDLSISYQAGSRNSRGPTTVTNYTVIGASKTNSSRTFNHHTRVYGTTDTASNMPPYLAVYMWKRTA